MADMTARVIRFARRILRDLPVLLQNLGVRGTFDFCVYSPFCELFLAKSRRTYSISLPGMGAVARIRAGTSDRLVFDQIFATREYRPLDSLSSIESVLDLGGNCGLSALWFLAEHPGCRVVVVEPDPVNLVALRANLAPYSDQVEIVAKAVWSSSVPLSLVRPVTSGKSEWATRVSAVTGAAVELVPAITVEELLEFFPKREVHVIKMDIEGAETELFANGASWSDRTRAIAVELHGSEARSLAQQVFPRSKWSMSESGELNIYFRLN